MRQLAYTDGRLSVLQPGKVRKFVSRVERITFAASYARKTGQAVLYITERAVFRLVDEGLELIEIAPGIDPERDIFPYMDFRPLAGSVDTMPEPVFAYPA